MLIIQRNWRASALHRYLYRRRKAAVRIQACWRSYRVRRSLVAPATSRSQHLLPPIERTQSSRQQKQQREGSSTAMTTTSGVVNRLAEVRRRLGEANRRARSNPLQCLGTRARMALSNLLQYTSVTQVLEALKHLGKA